MPLSIPQSNGCLKSGYRWRIGSATLLWNRSVNAQRAPATPSKRPGATAPRGYPTRNRALCTPNQDGRICREATQGIGRSQDLITIFGDQFGGGHFGSGTGDHGRNRETRTEIITAYSRDTCIGCIEGFANHRNHARNVEGRLHIIRRATPIELLRRCDTLAIGCAPNPADTMPTRVNVPNRVIPDITVPVQVLWVRAIRNNTIRRDEPPEGWVVITGSIVRPWAKWRSGMRSTGAQPIIQLERCRRESGQHRTVALLWAIVMPG